MYVKNANVIALSQESLNYWLREYEALSRTMRLKDAGIPTETPWVNSGIA